MLYSIAISLLVGVVGTALGGLLVSFIKQPGRDLAGVMMGFSGGIMLSIVLFDMFPESMGEGLFIPAIGAAAGGLVLHLLHGVAHGHEHGSDNSKNVRATGIMMVTGIALHNFPEGLAIGSGLAGGGETLAGNYGLALSLLMLLHNIPEGVALSVPLKVSGMGAWPVIRMAALAGFPTTLGTIVGWLVSSIHAYIINACIAFAGGAMLYLTVRELLPDALGLSDFKLGVASILGGVFVGLIMVLVI